MKNEVCYYPLISFLGECIVACQFFLVSMYRHSTPILFLTFPYTKSIHQVLSQGLAKINHIIATHQ
jgi:hypothetical protein